MKETQSASVNTQNVVKSLADIIKDIFDNPYSKESEINDFLIRTLYDDFTQSDDYTYNDDDSTKETLTSLFNIDFDPNSFNVNQIVCLTMPTDDFTQSDDSLIDIEITKEPILPFNKESINEL